MTNPDTAAPADSRTVAARLQALLGGDLNNQMGCADDEINAACERHPGAADTLYHAWILLAPTMDLMDTEFIYRAHCRELLERVVAGDDTRPGTAAEVILILSVTSARTPLTSPAAGLYDRMWAQAFPSHPCATDGSLEHHEALYGALIDEDETGARRKLAQPDRKLGTIECDGVHFGKQASCKHATTPTPHPPAAPETQPVPSRTQATLW